MCSRIHYLYTDVARSFAQRLHENVHVPVYFYGAASPRNNMLRDIRKKLGYFCIADREEDFQADLIDENLFVDPTTNRYVSYTC